MKGSGSVADLAAMEVSGGAAPDGDGDSAPAHSEAVRAVYRRRLEGAPVRARYIGAGPGRRVHIIEAGEGHPAVFLHGSSTSSLSDLPVLERLDGVQGIAVDRPGFGLSDPAQLPRGRYREAAVETVERVLDALGLAETALVGGSMGGTWALWYALAHPERVRRLVLLGAAPLLPGTRVPPLLRMMTTPLLGELLRRMAKPGPRMVVRMMASMGEGDTIVNHPELIESLVAAGNDPVAAAADLAELQAIISPLGFRPALLIRQEELRQLRVPTLLVWGDHDPVGTVDVAEAIADLIPNAQLEVLTAGHVPWLGNLDRTARLVSAFVR
jgi:pimeloyl-ACP methyl ester carboxylesterase